MPQATHHSHNYQHFEDLQMSAKEFYTMVRDMIKDYNYPDVELKVVSLKEKGFFSDSRDYLLIKWKGYHYYVCACPFGRSFFISWWLKEQEDMLTATVAKMGKVGRLMTGHHRPKTFFEVDTESMFCNAINSIVKLAVGKVMLAKGYQNPILQLVDTNV